MTGTYAFDIISEGGERIMEERFNKIEDMLSQLIHMVGTMKAEQEEMKADLGTVKREQGELKDTVNILKRDNEHAHKEMLETLKSLESDQDFIWQKAVKNERDIARYVKQQD
jgi:rubrerythrin